MKLVSRLSTGVLLLSGCNRLASIPTSPQKTPADWLDLQPYLNVKLAAVDFILVQPSSTLLVYSLGIIAIAAGLYFLRIRASHRSRTWWGIALLLWGFGALFAGTSYQAFSYEIKCAGREICSWTSWWEVIYLALSAASVDAMLVAGAYACCAGKWRKVLASYAGINLVVYLAGLWIGAMALNKFLISFELLLMVTAPSILALFVLNAWRYFKFRNKMDLALVIAWLCLAAAIGAYFLYLTLGITDVFWERGFWFSENDVLHIGLIGWMVYIAIKVADRVEDKPAPLKL